MNRNYLFTWNNYDEASIEYLRSEITAKAKYVIWGKEVAPTTGTLHLQGFVSFYNARTKSAAIKLLKGAHVTPVNVDNGCAKYSTKDGDYEEHGVRPKTQKEKGLSGGQAEKLRWEEAWKAAREGRIEDVPADIRYRYYKTTKEIAKDYMGTLDPIPKLENQWIYGPSGTGKTSSVLARYPDAYKKMANKWWDGYQGEETVLIDDLDKKHAVLAHHLKIWGDHNSFLAETKGGAILIRPKRILITSNHPLSIMAPEEPADLIALKRRYQEIHFDTMKKYDDTEPPKKKRMEELPSEPDYKLPPWEVVTKEPAWLYNNPEFKPISGFYK